RLAMELLQQIEGDVGLEFLDRVADRLQLVLHAERHDLVPRGAQRAHHVVFGLPDVDVLVALALQGIGRHQVGMQEDQDTQLFLHSANHSRREGLYRECTVFAVSSTVKLKMSSRWVPTARSFSSRQRAIISSSTESSVS